MFPMEQLTQEWTLPKNFRIDTSWFDHPSNLHGKTHTLRVMILADELYLRAKQESLFSSPTLYRDLMAAASYTTLLANTMAFAWNMDSGPRTQSDLSPNDTS